MQVYLITNTVNGKYYIGKTSRPLRRYFLGVLSSAERGERGRTLLHSAIRKYGRQSFVAETLAECGSEEQAFELEKLWIIGLASLDNSVGYNLTRGGEGISGFVPPTSLRRLWSEQRKGNQHALGMLHTRETKDQMQKNNQGENNPFFGKTHSLEARRKVAESNKRRVWNNASKVKMGAGVSAAFTEDRKKFMSNLAANRMRKEDGTFA